MVSLTELQPVKTWHKSQALNLLHAGIPMSFASCVARAKAKAKAKAKSQKPKPANMDEVKELKPPQG